MRNTKPVHALLISIAFLGACSSQAENDGLTSSASGAEAYAPGVPGGITTETISVTAVVKAVDPAKRTFVLEDEQGNRQTFHAIPEMRNFPQLKVGDRVNATVTQEQVVHLRQPGEAREDGVAGMLATTPEGAKPGMLAADSVEVTAVVKAIDTTQHTATLEFADGSRRTVVVRPDVELKNAYLNQEVVIRISTAMAISVEAPGAP